MKRLLFDFAIGILLAAMVYIIVRGVYDYRDRHQGRGGNTISVENHSQLPDSDRRDTVIRVPEIFNVPKK